MGCSIGIIESFELFEAVGKMALDIDEILFMADEKKRKGCKLVKTSLSADDRRRVVLLGKKCREWKTANM